MAKDSDTPEIRFPLRRSAVPAEPPVTPADVSGVPVLFVKKSTVSYAEPMVSA